MPKENLICAFIIILAIFAGFFCYPKYLNQGVDFLNQNFSWKLSQFSEKPFRLGLDLKGGVRLEYQADLSNIEEKEKTKAMEGLRDIIERRVNIYGATEPQVLIYRGDRLIVELPGVKSIEDAINWIGQTPWLEFLELRPEEETEKILAKIEEVSGKPIEELSQIEDWQLALEHPYFKKTQLTGRYLEKTSLGFDQTTYAPIIELGFDSEGAKIFEEITEKNVGKPLAIFLDGKSIIDTDGDGKITDLDLYAPRVQEKISGGKAVITGEKNVEQAKMIIQRLNQGALPVPLGQPISQKLIGPSLGEISLDKTVKAGIIGFLAIVLFMIIFYRLPGFFASLSLIFYLIFVLALFKLIPVTLTLAGVAGFLLSLGMAVDANILIFSRMREELNQGENHLKAIEGGFHRAWPAIRDGNFTTILVGLILFWLGTSFIQGFAFTLIIGNLIGMIAAIFITNSFLKIFARTKARKINFFW
ncbi:MAG: protein translocase subunit SecD [Candidatus Nealsonbacteria bacterium CG02_land_8_20_14_3_00_34_20]|uniref:Protein translocase subunit SecD n=2 Tax=Candidatus Nealsoniibacteriota TaxID=1817911 RepID=A0A2M7DAQ9_9BACT|nr:MAG: protein translocase subunit SecD [Candidatus Nealsonbacteria bacterium CG11_big_fil_rev_8_21_14_0_20_35_11]PIV45536.1 MAG: protein translocase subunit SecD [Candidatus Nealsonbacteria bacterium CG02_land_8_20_14_3_00_34_20]